MNDETDPVADALASIARALRDLGNADATTPMGAIEAFGVVVREVGDAIGDAIREGLFDIAAAIRERKDGDE